MTKQKSTKRALLSSALALLLCVSMLVGTTFAWFTDSVQTGSNIIKSGNLDVTMHYMDGKYAPTAEAAEWQDAEGAAIFDYALWEPGYTQVRHIKISNEGSLALKYKLNIIANGTVTDLAKVIDVYYIDPAEEAITDRTQLTEDDKLNTLDKVLENMSSDATTAAGSLAAEEEVIVTIALKMQETAGNEYQNLSIGTDFTVLLVATQDTVEWDSFDETYDADAAYPRPYITAANIGTVDFTEPNKTFVLAGNFDALSIAELGEGSVIAFAGATVKSLAFGSDATVTGKATIGGITATRNSTTPIALTIEDATLDVTGNISVGNTDGESALNITDSSIDANTIYVGANVSKNSAATAVFNVKGSDIALDEGGGSHLGSTIAIDGRSGVDATIYDSEIYTYSRGWHQSEDANDNSITFLGNSYINVDIQRSNMHLYGARSIVNAREYGSEECTTNFTIDDSLIWVVTKSNHAAETLPVWNVTEITDSVLLFTKNVYNGNGTPVSIKTDVYGNPVIHGNYAVTTQCGWATDVPVADGQTVTIAKDASVSVYDGAAAVNFVLEGSGKVVVEAGATMTNIGVKAASGHVLNTETVNGSTVYTVTATKPEGTTEVSDGLYQATDGTYYITSAEGLAAMGTMVADEASYDDDGTWVLYADVDMSGVEWTPINGFYGTFDGNGKTISNLTVNTTGVAGLFGTNADNKGVDSQATRPTIKDLTLTGAKITGNENVGVLAGNMGYASIENVTVTDAVVNGNKYVGAIVGRAYTNGGITVSGCTVSNSTLTTDNGTPDGKVGGIGGFVAIGTVKNNTVTGCQISGPECVGGILGRGGSGETVAVVYGNTVSGNTVTSTEAETGGELVGDSLNVKTSE